MKSEILVGITMSLLLLTLPAAASDFTLGVFGNANEDDTINMQDVTYTELIILEYRDQTELADGKYDGKINMQDVTQIELIILGRELEITVLDSADRAVTVEKPLERIIPATGNFVEAMRSLKQDKDVIVGVSEHTIEDEIFFPEFSDYPSIGTWHFDVEKVLSLYPDVVFTYASYQQDEREKLEDAGVTVVCFDLYRPGDIYIDEIKKLGYILDKEEEAERFIEFYEGHLNAVEDLVKDITEEDKPDVYLESTKPYATAGEGAGWHQKVVAAGGDNIFSDLSGYVTVDAEEVAERNPAIIVKLKHGSPDPGGYDVDDPAGMIAMRAEVMNRPELSGTTAVREEQVYAISDSIYSGGHYFIGITYLAKWFHPVLFENLDPQAIHQEYLTEFQELDYDLSEHGVFVYPPLES